MRKSEDKAYSYTWVIDQFSKAEKHANSLVSNNSEETFLRRPAPDRWSAAECLDHLVEFGNIYFDTINRGLERAAIDSVSGQAVFKPRLIWRWVIRFFEPPYKMKLKTISSFKPQKTAGKSAQQVYESFAKLQHRFIDQIERSRKKGIDLDATKVGNPALPFLKMTLSECYAVAEAHQRRHLWQAEQTIKALKNQSN